MMGHGSRQIWRKIDSGWKISSSKGTWISWFIYSPKSLCDSRLKRYNQYSIILVTWLTVPSGSTLHFSNYSLWR
jgi:hypothetical protein